MFFTIGQQGKVFEAPNEGAGGGGAAHPVEAPWAGAEGVWNLGEGETAQPWHASIPEEGARQHVEAKGYKNPAELALANYNLTKLQRGDPTVIGVPGTDATPEQMSEFYGKLGRPDTADGYEFKFADDVKVDEGMMSFAKDAFHKAGLTPAQAQTVADEWNAFSAKQLEDFQGKIADDNGAELEALKAKWGADLDKNTEAGRRVTQALGLEAELIGKIEQQIGSAAIVELLATIGRKSDEGGFLTGDGGGDPNDPAKLTPAQAQERINELSGDAEFQKKYTDKNHPEHAGAVDTMMKLYAKV
jgi:hypothetical protein